MSNQNNTQIRTDKPKSPQSNKSRNSLLLYGAILFVLIYIIYTIFQYRQSNPIFSYQVKEGNLANSVVYTGLILRDEEVIECDYSGYVNYFAREGERVGIGNLVYTIDETGIMDNLMSHGEPGENALTNEDLADLRRQIISFENVFDKTDFYDTYDFLYACDGTVLKLANMNVLSSLDELGNGIYSEQVKLGNAAKTGYVAYYLDGYETVSRNGIQKDLFDKSTYEKTQLINKALVDAGTPVYKVIHDENWEIIVPITEEKANALRGESYLQIRFVTTQNKVWAKSEVFENEGEFYLSLSLNNSLIQFITDRFVELELMEEAEIGLKIPTSSIVYKTFYIVPEEYAVSEGEDNYIEFMKKCFNTDGSVSNEIIPIEVYAYKDGEFYVDSSQLKNGDYLIRTITAEEALAKEQANNIYAAPEETVSENTATISDPNFSAFSYDTDSSTEGIKENAAVINGYEEYPIGRMGELVGVYNINKGYADFRRIIILYQNDEYAIVKSNTEYGLNIYDFIVLDSTTIEEDAFIYE